MKTIFNFGSLSEQALQAAPTRSKDIKVLGCTDACTDFDESQSPAKRLCNNRQLRTIYGIFSTYRINLPHISSVEMVYNTLKLTQPRRGKNTGVCLTDFTGQNKRNDKRPIADKSLPISYPFWMGVRGQTDFFTSLLNCTLSCWSLPYNQLIIT